MTMLDPALDGTDPALNGADPAAPLTQPLPAPPAPNPQDADADGYSLLAALADPDAAASNPQRFWQQRRPALPIRAYEQEPTDDEREKVRQVVDMFQEARQERSPMFEEWKRNYRNLLNRSNPPARRPDWINAPQFPEILPITLTMAGWITDQRPDIDVTGMTVPHSAFSESIEAMARDLKFAMNASYLANKEEHQVNIAAIDAIVYGTAIFKTTWNGWAAGGLGDGTFTRVSPFNFYPDPTARDENDGNYYIEARRMTLLELDRRYPGTYELFDNGQGGGDFSIDEPPNRVSFTRATRQGPTAGALAPSTSPSQRRSGSGRMTTDQNRTITVLECWVREHETVEVKDPRTGEWTSASSDEWRLLVVANNRLIFEAHAKDLWDHGKHPYDRWAFIELGDSFWGMGMVEMLTSPQAAYNRMLASFSHNAELTGNPILMRPKGKGRSPVTNRPGQVIETDAQEADAKWLDPPQLQMSQVQVLEFYLKRMEAISGLTAVVKGSTPSGRNAQGVVDSIQEAAFVRIRQTLRNLEYALRGVFVKKASLICTNYTTPRMIATAGPQSQKTSIALKGGHFLIPGADGSVPFAYQLHVDAGSQMHTSRAMREDRAVQLFTLGAIDEEALLSDVGYPNWREVAQRVQEKQAQQMMQEPGARERQRA